jgi:putative colanic acid biosynthesis acetyltransferase WcaF
MVHSTFIVLQFYICTLIDVMDALKTQLNKFTNNWYTSGASKPKMLLWYFVNLIFFTSRWLPVSAIKVALLRIFGAQVGSGVVIKPAVNIKYPWRLKIGNHVWIGEQVWIDNLENVEIGDHVCISQGAMLLCGNHNYKKSTFDLMVGKIILEEGTWIGAQTVVCPGVVCKSHAILTVGSVATSELKAYTIYQGNPAKAIKERVISN